jgi:hypothetical protein
VHVPKDDEIDAAHPANLVAVARAK